jgi:glycosyltransferase involved in cell wall biosynthesis
MRYWMNEIDEINEDERRSAASGQRFLIFNFFANILQRGIPIYAQNLRIALEQEGISCREVRCPLWLTHLPRSLLNLLFVMWEQIVTPLLGITYQKVIYPYNSTSILDTLLNRSVLIVHDFIPNAKNRNKFSARYIAATQCIHRALGRTVIYASFSTQRIGRLLKLFPKSKTFVFPNTFYEFINRLQSNSYIQGNYILLCTGWGKHKDLKGALELYRSSGLYLRRNLKILGIAGHQEEVEEFRDNFPEVAGRIAVLPQLEDTEVIRAYKESAWVWVHSRREGYGRCVAEAKICGCRTVATDILPFREQQNGQVFLYSGLNGFIEAWSKCEMEPVAGISQEPKEHELLRLEIRRFLREQ